MSIFKTRRLKVKIPPLPADFADKFLETEITLSEDLVYFEDVSDYIQLCSKAIEFWESKDNNKMEYYKTKMQTMLTKNNVIEALKRPNIVRQKAKNLPLNKKMQKEKSVLKNSKEDKILTTAKSNNQIFKPKNTVFEKKFSLDKNGGIPTRRM